MAYSARRNRFTIFDMMEARGDFATNPANVDSQDPLGNGSLYKGPVPFPRMFYHPKGETRILRPGEVLLDRDGLPRVDRQGREIVLGELREIIWQLAHDADEEAKLRAEGWHDHPALAIAAGGGQAPAMSSDQRITELEKKLAAAQAELEQAQKARKISEGLQAAKPSPKPPSAILEQ